jgi:hypothetical protein
VWASGAQQSWQLSNWRTNLLAETPCPIRDSRAEKKAWQILLTVN